MPEWEAVIEPVDRENGAGLLEIIGRYGWPGHRLAGEASAHAAWLLAQHAPPDLQEECLRVLKDAVAQDDASPADLAYLMDRVLMHQGEPQIHGTQYQVRDGVLVLWPVRDPAGRDQRRAALGLAPEAANRARLLVAEGLTGEHPDDEPTAGGFFGDAFARLRSAAPGVEGIAGCPFLVFYGEVRDDSDGRVELCRWPRAALWTRPRRSQTFRRETARAQIRAFGAYLPSGDRAA
jgi:hypothetical protein